MFEGIVNACKRLPYDFYNLPGTNDYFYLRYVTLDPQEARRYCLQQGMDLPSITNQQQNDLIFCEFNLVDRYANQVLTFLFFIRFEAFIKKSSITEQMFHTAGLILSNNSYGWMNGDDFSYLNFPESNIFNSSIKVLVY
jgi:hypothetical protein